MGNTESSSSQRRSRPRRSCSISRHLCALLKRLTLQDRALPPHWETIDPQHGNRVLVHLRAASSKHAKELDAITTNFKQTMPLAEVHAVYRIQNASQHLNFERCRRELQQEGIPFWEHPRVYHGTKANHPRLIYESNVGFDPRRCINRPRDGRAVAWFTRDASYLAQTLYAFPSVESLPVQHRSSYGGLAYDVPGFMAVLEARVIALEGESSVTSRTHMIDEAKRTCTTALIIYTQ